MRLFGLNHCLDMKHDESVTDGRNFVWGCRLGTDQTWSKSGRAVRLKRKPLSVAGGAVLACIWIRSLLRISVLLQCNSRSCHPVYRCVVNHVVSVLCACGFNNVCPPVFVRIRGKNREFAYKVYMPKLLGLTRGALSFLVRATVLLSS